MENDNTEKNNVKTNLIEAIQRYKQIVSDKNCDSLLAIPMVLHTLEQDLSQLNEKGSLTISLADIGALTEPLYQKTKQITSHIDKEIDNKDTNAFIELGKERSAVYDILYEIRDAVETGLLKTQDTAKQRISRH